MFQGVTPQGQSSSIAYNCEIPKPSSVVEAPKVLVTQHLDDKKPPKTSTTMFSQSFQRGLGSTGEGSIDTSYQLYKVLDAARISGLQAHTYFVPLNDLERLVTVTLIERIILDGHPNMKAAEARRYAEKTETSAKKLFANLAWQKKGATICALLDSGISDQNLPFQRKRKRDGQMSLWLMKVKQHIQAFDEWESKDIEEFERTQWWMMAPVFDRDCLNCQELADLAILPFSPMKEHSNQDEEEDDEEHGEEDGENREQKDIRNDRGKGTGIPHKNRGGYSEVKVYRIHPAHHNFWDTSMPPVRSLIMTLEYFTNIMQERQPLIADKKLTDSDEADFQKEKSILEILGPSKHKHLILLLSCYKKKKHYHLLFPCANSNLRSYWENNESPSFDKNTVLWSIKQMFGITSALDCIHVFEVKFDLNVSGKVRLQDGGAKLILKAGEEKFGRHGDIKPENILWFKDGDVLKLTDFGLGRFHGRDSRSHIDPRKISGTLTYEPPECSLARGVSRKYDIWSLGCLFLEFVTWLLKGAAKITEFANKRGLETGFINDDTFFTVFTDINHQKDASVREGVIHWVDDLHTHKRCTQLIHDLLDLVMGSMLKVDPDERQPAEQLKEEMEKLVQKAEESDIYLIEAAPRPLNTPIAASRPSTGQRVHFADQ
jgi:serine/threonine protein kinase